MGRKCLTHNCRADDTQHDAQGCREVSRPHLQCRTNLEISRLPGEQRGEPQKNYSGKEVVAIEAHTIILSQKLMCSLNRLKPDTFGNGLLKRKIRLQVLCELGRGRAERLGAALCQIILQLR